jgi:hypothetical protein
MKRLSTLLAVAALVIGGAAMAAEYSETGYLQGGGYLVLGDDSQCGTLLMNADGSYENGYCWQYGGVVPPDYGAFAECYFGEYKVCANIYDLTQVGNDIGQTMDCYVWNDAGGVPGGVCDLKAGVDPGPIAFWPTISRHVVTMNDYCCGPDFWVGYYGNWPGALCAWFVGADLDGFGGCPFTNTAPGIGFPTGWNNVSGIWGPTAAIGLGCEVNPCGPNPTEETTWGQIKAIFNN